MEEQFNLQNSEENWINEREHSNNDKFSLKNIFMVFFFLILYLIFAQPEPGEKPIKTIRNSNKNLVYVISDVSKSLEIPYKYLYSTLKGNYISPNALLNFIDFYADLNKTDIILSMVGTKKVKSIDLVHFLENLHLYVNENSLREKIDNYEKEAIYKCKNQDKSVEEIYKIYILNEIKLGDYFKQFSEDKNNVLLYYMQKDTYFESKILKFIINQYDEYNSLWFWNKWFYEFKFPEDLIKEKIRPDMISLIINENIKIEKYEGEPKINNLENIYDIIKSIKDLGLNLDNIKYLLGEYVGDEVNLEEALINASQIISSFNKTYENKIILLITDGNTRGNSLEKISEKIKNELKAKLIVFFISSHKLNRPKEFFSEPINEFNKRELDLFNSASSLDPKFFTFLRHKNLIIPTHNKIKLFIQGNDKNIVKTFIESFKNFINNNELLFNIIGKLELDQYINGAIQGFAAKQQVGGTCYAYASATAIHMTLMGLYGEYAQTFEQIKDNLIYEYGKDGANTTKVLDKHLSNFTLKYKIVNETEAIESIHNGTVCIGCFWMTQLDFLKFQTFFETNKSGILTKELLEKTIPNPNYVKDKTEEELNEMHGHAVVLVSSTNKYLRFLNSWGTNFGEFGFFKIDNSQTLNIMKYLKIYYDYDELTQSQKDKHEKFKRSLTKTYFNNYENYEKLLKIETQCPYCGEKSEIGKFYSEGSLDSVRCPECNEIFEVYDEKLIQKLYFDLLIE